MSASMAGFLLCGWFIACAACIALTCWMYGRMMEKRNYSWAAFQLAILFTLMSQFTRNAGRIAEWLME